MGTNSLIIYGTAQEFQNIKNILKDLDAIPRQVLIEALIFQVDLKDTDDFGVNYQILAVSSNHDLRPDFWFKSSAAEPRQRAFAHPTSNRLD